MAVDADPAVATKHRVKLAQTAIARIDSAFEESHCFHVVLAVKLWKTVISPTLLFGVQVWGPLCRQGHWDKLQRVQTAYFRKALQLPKSTSIDIMLAELGIYIP